MSKTYIPVVLRRQVYERAKGCCEYCLIPDVATFAPHEIDHIIAEKHGGRTENVSYC
jgi:5-methylcytosine-specific restriction endonuclease McrA